MSEVTATNLHKQDTPPTTTESSNPAYEFFFTETYQQLPKLRLAPDLLVYINNSRTFRTWLGESFDFNDWLVSASGSAGMDRQNSCNLTFYIPRHLEHYFVGLGGRFILRPFQEVEIYAKGRFLVDASADEYSSEAELYGSQLDVTDPNPPLSRFYRIFWGWIQSITSEWQEGDYQIVVQCSMALRVMELTHLRNNLVALGSIDRQGDISPFDNPGIQGNPFHVIVETFAKNVTFNTEINCVNVATASQADRAIYSAGNMGVNESYKRNAARTLLIWNQRIQELQKRTTIFGLGYSDPDKNKTNEAPFNQTSAAALASEYTRRTVSQASGDSKTTLLDLKTKEKSVVKAQLEDAHVALSKAKSLHAAKEAELSKKRLTDFKFVLGVVKDSGEPSITILNPPSSSVIWLDPNNINSVKELRLVSDIDNLDLHPLWVKKINDYITNQLRPYADDVTKALTQESRLTERLLNLDKELSALSQEVSVYTASKKSESKTPSKSPVIGPVTIADLISTSKSTQVSNPKQSPVDGPKTKNTQDKKTGAWSLYVQDWASANYCPFYKLGDFKLFNFDENTTRLDILTRMADAIGYEFYQDLSGNIIFKPPFYNMDTRDDAVFNINDIDIMTEQFSEDEGQIKVTSAVVQGSYSPVIEESTPSEIRPMSQHIDLALIAKYGQRTKTISMPMIRTSEQAHVYAVSSIAKENRFAKRLNIQIPARPELMLGFPVYLQGRDCFGYLERINWSYSAGNDFTFQLELTSIRRRIYMNRNRLESLYKSRKGVTVKDAPKTDSKADPGKSTPTTTPAPAKKTEEDKKPEVKASDRCFPLAKDIKFKISGAFKEKRINKNNGTHYLHQGVDLAGFAEGTTVFASCDNATVYLVDGPKHINGDSLSVVLETPDKLYICFRHLLDVSVKVGEVCQKNTPIGVSGGGVRSKEKLKEVYNFLGNINSSGPHLHWSISKCPPTKGIDNYIDPYTWLDPNASCTSKDAKDPKCDAPVPSMPTFSVEFSRDAGLVTTRASSGTNLTDMVPLPYACIQIFRDTALESHATPQDYILTGTLTSTATQDATRDLKTAKKLAEDLSKYKTEFDALEKFLSIKSTTLSRDLSRVNTDLALAKQYSSTSLNVPEDPVNLVPSYQALKTEKYQDYLTKRQTYKSRQFYYDQDDSPANKSLLDLAKNLYVTAYVAASDECKSSLEERRKSLSNDIDKANNAINENPALIKLKKEIKDTENKLTTSVQSANETFKDKLAYQQGQAQEYSTTEVDDVLDADPDCQIFAFGQDTFKDPNAQFSLSDSSAITDKTKSIVAAKERKLDATAYLRPNIYHPYRIVIDEKFMGPLSTRQPDLSQDSGDLVKSSISWREGNIPATQPDVTTAEKAAKEATESLSEVTASLTNFENELANEVAKKKSADLSITQINSSLVLKSDVDSFSYVLKLYDNGQGLTNVSKLRAKLPTTLFENFVSKPEYSLSNEPYALSVFFGEDPELADFISFVKKCLDVLQKTYETQQESLKNLTQISKTCGDRIETLTKMIESSTALKTRLQGVQTSALRRKNAISRGTAGDTAVKSESYNIMTYSRLLTVQQPYTDANGFEQIAGFPWGRSVSVTSTVDSLRLDATAKRFVDMSPQITSKKSKSAISKQSSELPQNLSKSGIDAVATLANIEVRTKEVTEALGSYIPPGLALAKGTVEAESGSGVEPSDEND